MDDEELEAFDDGTEPAGLDDEYWVNWLAENPELLASHMAGLLSRYMVDALRERGFSDADIQAGEEFIVMEMESGAALASGPIGDEL